MGIYVFRHGETEYKQGNDRLTLGKANDLTPEGERIVRASASHLANLIASTERGYTTPVKIHTSPMGRCIHSSEIIGNVLTDEGLNVLPIELNEDLEEVRNFDWKLFFPLVSGGKVSYAGNDFEIDSRLTNPEELSISSYFRSDAAHNLHDSVTANMPADYLVRVRSFEKFPNITTRFNAQLEKIAKSGGMNHVATLHEALIGKMIEKLTGNKDAYLGRGKYFGVKFDGEFVPYFTQEDAVLID